MRAAFLSFVPVNIKSCKTLHAAARGLRLEETRVEKMYIGQRANSTNLHLIPTIPGPLAKVAIWNPPRLGNRGAGLVSGGREGGLLFSLLKQVYNQLKKLTFPSELSHRVTRQLTRASAAARANTRGSTSAAEKLKRPQRNATCQVNGKNATTSLDIF